MFKPWAVVVCIMIFLIWSKLVFLKNPLHIFVLTEICWVLLIVWSCLLSLYYSDPRFYLLSVVFLFCAAVEVVVYLETYVWFK